MLPKEKLAVAMLVFAAHAAILALILRPPADRLLQRRISTVWLSILDDRAFVPPGLVGQGINLCRHEFNGFGLRHSFGGVITEVAPGYPAAAAGLQVGDLVLNLPALGETPAGTIHTFKVVRGGSIRSVPARAGRICMGE